MNEIILIILDKYKLNILMCLMWLTSLTVIYFVGLDHGFIDRATLCRDDIIYLNQCQLDLNESHKQCAEDLINCKANCIVDECKKHCIDEAKKAVDNYKKLMQAIECR